MYGKNTWLKSSLEQASETALIAAEKKYKKMVSKVQRNNKADTTISQVKGEEDDIKEYLKEDTNRSDQFEMFSFPRTTSVEFLTKKLDGLYTNLHFEKKAKKLGYKKKDRLEIEPSKFLLEKLGPQIPKALKKSRSLPTCIMLFLNDTL